MPLRLRDRSQFGREIDCPDCGTRLRIVAEPGNVQAVRAAANTPFTRPARPRPTAVLRWIWLATACLGGVTAWLALRPRVDEEARMQPAEVTDAEPSPELTTPEPAVVEPSVAAVPPEPAIEPGMAEPPTAEPPMTASTPPPVVEPPVAVVDPDHDRPIQPEFAPDEPAIDIPAQLSLRIAEFSQRKPVAVRLLLHQIAELSAVPVDLSRVEVEPWRDRLDREITVELTATTVGGVLDEILNQAGFHWKEIDAAITIMPRSP